MKIDYDSARTISKNVWFTGENESGDKFIIMANWDSSDDWSVDDVQFDEESKEMSDEDKEGIIQEFEEYMNG